MNAIAKADQATVTTPTRANTAMDQKHGPLLDHVLQDLARFGAPRISMPNGTGWYCSVDVNVNATGAKFEVASDFRKENPMAAALECQQRLRSALAALGVAA